MHVYRLFREKYANVLSGAGSAIKGARWNSIGVELIYTAENKSLAMAEVAVHFTWATLPTDYMMATISIPDDLPIDIVNVSALEQDWQDFPHPVSTQKFGDKFVIHNKYCMLKVPSVVTKGDYNFLINPMHKNFNEISIVKTENFPFDKRMVR